ncbi:MAG: formate dehydrogenase accessory sulfurtransferase FdhD [Bacillota bacterium]
MSRDKYIMHKITRVRSGEEYLVEELEDRVTVETPITIYVNGSELVTLLCTPEKIDRLALGFLRSEGILTAADQLESIRVEDEEGLVEVELKEKSGLAEKLYGKRTVTSGCGKGTVFFNVLDSLRSKPLSGKMEVRAERVLQLMENLQQKAQLFKETGGVHSAALADDEKILYFYEDIGRHNAIDKIVGECFLEGVNTDDKIIVTSGRLSSEILLKVAKLQVQLIISRAAPTSLCIELADNLNITLVGFVRGKRLNIYSHGWRINYK